MTEIDEIAAVIRELTEKMGVEKDPIADVWNDEYLDVRGPLEEPILARIAAEHGLFLVSAVPLNDETIRVSFADRDELEEWDEWLQGQTDQ